MPPKKKRKNSSSDIIDRHVILLDQAFKNDSKGDNRALEDKASELHKYVQDCPEGLMDKSLAVQPKYPGLNLLLFSAVKLNDLELLRYIFADKRTKNVKNRGASYYDEMDNRRNGFMACPDSSAARSGGERQLAVRQDLVLSAQYSLADGQGSSTDNLTERH